MMKNLLLSTAYLPPIDQFAQILRHEQLWLEAHENYTRQTYRNRCLIYGPNGVQRLSIPVIHPGPDQRGIRDIRIDYRLPWQSIHWRSIETAYLRSAFFMYYADELKQAFFLKQECLWEHNLELLRCLLRILRMDCVIAMTRTYQKEPEGFTDLRAHLRLQQAPMKRYPQVFEPVHGFIPGLSMIDLLFNRGPDSLEYLKEI